MNIIFYNQAHNGDLLFTKSFLKQFCELNKNFNISYVIEYNSFLFSDISNLNIIIPNIENKYNNTEFNGNYIDPINYITINNDIYINYTKIFNNNFDNINYTIINNNIYIKLWIKYITDNYTIQDVECNIFNINNYYNNIINNINNKYNLNIKLINNCNLLPEIPYTNIDNFLSFKKNKKIIFYYNYNPNAVYDIELNKHDYYIQLLSEKYKDYIICCALKPNYNSKNIISIEDFGYIKEPSCENIAKALYCAMNSEYVISFDVGACFYYSNNKFNEIFKGIWIHKNANNNYILNKYINSNNIIYIDNINKIFNIIK
jgi:hypothetical protein